MAALLEVDPHGEVGVCVGVNEKVLVSDLVAFFPR